MQLQRRIRQHIGHAKLRKSGTERSHNHLSDAIAGNAIPSYIMLDK
jgi:hypothetical protein